MSDRFTVVTADCREHLRTMRDCSVDSIVTDPPYELGFMGKTWDSTGIAYQVDVWRECLRVLKHGGHLLAFGGSRTYHRMACAIEDAGFQIRDQIMWVYGSGFPKSLDVSKAIDKAAGAEREVISSVFRDDRAGTSAGIMGDAVPRTDTTSAPATDAAKQWEGWGTALKPAHEPIVLARKPLDGTVAQNVIWYGTGALNIDECRVERQHDDVSQAGNRTATFGHEQTVSGGNGSGGWQQTDAGRFPANFIHDGSDEVLELFPETKPDSGSAARFFYCAKTSTTDRNEGLDDLPDRRQDEDDYERAGTTNPRNRSQKLRRNHHPTVKPTALMRYLCRLITPPHGLILDPFCGSGSTGKAAMLDSFRFIGIDQSDDYATIARARIAHSLASESHEE